MNEPKLLVGWREWVRLPELGVPRIKAKVDTGAKTSALHAENLRFVRRRDRRFVRFTIHPGQRTKVGAVEASAPFLGERRVRSSSGVQEIRPVILTLVALGDRSWPIEITLTRRDVMGFRMLLGRQAIRRFVVVDPNRSYVTQKISRKK